MVKFPREGGLAGSPNYLKFVMRCAINTTDVHAPNASAGGSDADAVDAPYTIIASGRVDVAPVRGPETSEKGRMEKAAGGALPQVEDGEGERPTSETIECPAPQKGEEKGSHLGGNLQKGRKKRVGPLRKGRSTPKGIAAKETRRKDGKRTANAPKQ